MQHNQIQIAIKYYKKVSELAREQGNREIEANAYIWLGFAHKETNQIQTAIQNYEKALEIATTQKDKETEIMVRSAIEQFATVGGKVRLVDGIFKSGNS